VDPKLKHTGTTYIRLLGNKQRGSSKLMDVRLFRGKNVFLTTTCLKELYLSWMKEGVRSGIRRTCIESRDLKLDKITAR
jgi:hypothetical protein